MAHRARWYQATGGSDVVGCGDGEEARHLGAGTARGSRRVTPREQGTGVGCGLAVITGIVTLTVIVLAAVALFILMPRGTTSTSAVVQAQPGAAAWNSDAPTTLLLVGA